MAKSISMNDAERTALYERSGAAAYGVSVASFTAILDEVFEKQFAASSGKTPPNSPQENLEFYRALRMEELVLARACAAGNERAWHDFISRYRQKMHSMALHITRDAAHAAELADSLFGDLYGISSRDGVRNSKLLFYMGRGSLEGWLRTVMAQEFINRYRKQKRTVSLEEQTEEGAQFAAEFSEPLNSGHSETRKKLEAVTDESIAELSAEDRFTLASYYLDGRTLAEIAAVLKLHESSISRRLERLSTNLRKRIMAGLRAQGLSHAQAVEALDTDVRDLELNLRSNLTQDSGPTTFSTSRGYRAQKIDDGSGD
jgi:RNA polymerase sigma-70 factor, ECF subfamily